ncbi:MAG: glycosyltransferase family 4 protein [Gammaproteobacteria bacterium]
MKFMIFTPAALTSAIGRMAFIVSQALIAGGHEVNHVRTECNDLIDTPTHPFNGSCIPWTDIDAVAALSHRTDIVIYHIGNNPAYHIGGLSWIPHLPGIICLHDFFVGSLFFELAKGNHEYAADIIMAWYGEPIPDGYWTYNDADNLVNDTKDTLPMTEWICSYATAVMTHSCWAIDRVLASCPGPVQVAALPISISKTDCHFAAPKLNTLFNVLTVGDVNNNKRIDKVIQAIGSSSLLRSKTIYRVAGNIDVEKREKLTQLANSLQVTLVLLGKVDDATLNYLFEEADVVTCLRWPCIESASASLIEALLHEKATIVTHSGCYSELPDDYVIKINIQNEHSDLVAALEFLHGNPEKRRAMGKNAAVWAKTAFSATHYANELVKLSLLTLDAIPILNATKSFKKIMASWHGNPALNILDENIKPLLIFESY